MIGLPHSVWRPLQAETVQWCIDLQGVGLIEAPVGSGKTSYAAA